MRRALLPILLASAVALASGAAQRPTFRSGVSGVRLDVLVLDDGRPVGGLTSANFEVLDNGVRQAVTATAAGATPLDVVYVLDRSASVAGETLACLVDAVRATLAALGEPDRAALLSFSHLVSLDAGLQADRAAVGRAVDRVAASGATAAIDAVYSALSLAEGSGRRTLVLLFTDGYDNRSWLTPDEIVHAARESEVVICGVAFDPPGPTLSAPHAQASPHVELLRRLSEATGGEVLTTRRGADLAPAFARIMSAMRARYLLTYTPAAEKAGWHDVAVRLKHARGRVVVRPGYRVR